MMEGAELRPGHLRAGELAVEAPWRLTVRILAALLQRELQGFAASLRLRALATLVIVLMGLSAWIYGVGYQRELAAAGEAQAHYRASLEGQNVAQLAAQLHPAAKPPWRLAFLADGAQVAAPDLYRQALSAWVEPELSRQGPGNERLQDAEALDWLFFLRVVLPLGAFLLAYDAFSGERHRARLKLLLSFPVSRLQLLSAKLFALWLALAVPFLAGAVVSLAILALGGLRPTSAELVKIALVAGVGLWAVAVYGLIGLLISLFCRETSRSLVILAVLWLLGVVVIPAAGGLLAPFLAPLPSVQQVAEAMTAIRLEVEAERGGPGSWRTSRTWAEADDFALERHSAATQNQRYERQEALRRDLVEQQLAQAELARRLAAVSPMALVEELGERLTGSGVERDRAFVVQAWAFGDVLRQHVERLDRDDPASPHVLFFPGYLSERAIDPASVPRFHFRERTPGEGLAAAAPGLLVLTLLTLLLLAAVRFAVAQCDLS